MPNRITHFEIHATNPEILIEFYTKVFDWEIKKWEGGEMEYWMIMSAPQDSTEPGINGGLLRRPCATPEIGAATNAFVCTMVVENFDATAEKIMAAGGQVALPKFNIADMAWQGYFIDPDHNTFGIHQVMAKNPGKI